MTCMGDTCQVTVTTVNMLGLIIKKFKALQDDGYPDAPLAFSPLRPPEVKKWFRPLILLFLFAH